VTSSISGCHPTKTGYLAGMIQGQKLTGAPRFWSGLLNFYL